jgi:hypothetical protein
MSGDAVSSSTRPCHRPDHLTPLVSQIVFNPPTYPNFLRFLKLHKRTVEVIETDMTFSVSRDGGMFEWAGASLRSVFCQTKRVFDPGMWRMLFDIARFNTCAVRVLSEGGDPTVGEYLEREGYSQQFRDNYLLVCALSHAHLWIVLSYPTAYDCGGMEHPTRYMRYRLPCQERCSVPLQSRLHATQWKAYMANYQRWQVRRVYTDASSF